MKRKIIKLLIGIGVFFAVVLCYAFWGHAADEAKFNRLKRGMTEADVVSHLGEPSYRAVDDEGERIASQRWGYQSDLPFKWCGMEVFFGPDGTVTGWFHDH